MYTAKLFDDLMGYTPAMTIADRRSKTLLDAIHYAITKASELDIPGFDPIIRIDMYTNGVYVDTGVLKDGSFIF